MVSKKDISAIIITYNPDIEIFKKNIQAIAKQVEFVFVIDNASENLPVVAEVISDISNAGIIKNNQNMGIATALNQGMIASQQAGYLWAITLDQDSICEEQMINKMVPYIAPDVGIVCPSIDYVGMPKLNRPQNEEVKEIEACMTSASLTNIDAWDKVGRFNDKYFIDFVDNELCMKLRLHDFKILRIRDSVLQHRLGETVSKTILGHTFYGVVHSPFRIYYMVRNNIWFIRTYNEDIDVCLEVLKLLYVLVLELYWSNKKWQAVLKVKDGIFDGICVVYD